VQEDRPLACIMLEDHDKKMAEEIVISSQACPRQ
jgi:hypothetical protein